MATTDLDRLNRWLTLSANLAVVAGIIFVAVELRQNNEMAELQRAAIQDERVNSLTDMVIADAELVELMTREPSTLDTAERARLELLGIRLLMGFEDSYLVRREGDADFERMLRVQRAIYRRPVVNYGGPLAWEAFKQRGDPGFVQWFEANVIAD